MEKIDLKNSAFVINLGSSVKNAMGSITENQRGLVVVIDEQMIFQGIITDGDIRRAMLKGATIDTPVSKIINTNPIIIKLGNDVIAESEKIFNQRREINVIPVVGENNLLVDVMVRDPQKRKEL